VFAYPILLEAMGGNGIVWATEYKTMSLDVTLTNKKCQHCGSEEEVYSSNITHNLGKMADAAGIYMHCWRPNEIGIFKASQLIEPLRKGIQEMKDDPDKFKKHDSPNGWGLYVHFLPWLEAYVKACEENPDACVSTDC